MIICFIDFLPSRRADANALPVTRLPCVQRLKTNSKLIQDFHTGSEHGSNSRTSISALLVAAFHSNFSLGQLCRSPSQEQQSLRRLQLATKIAAWSQCRCMGVAVEAPSPDEEVTMTENAIEVCISSGCRADINPLSS